MDKRTEAALERAAGEIMRATDAVSEAAKISKQPRFREGGGGSFWTTLEWLELAEVKVPAYQPNSRKRDARLREIWKLEPRLAGILNGVTLIDQNRGWEMVGGRNQVRRFTTLLHNAEAGEGWRQYFAKSSLSYWATDLGSLTECGRDGQAGPLRALYHVDSARCRLTGEPDTPLEYQPAKGGPQKWLPSDFYRVASMPSDDEKYNGLGLCAVSRCIELARTLYAVLVHDQEQLAARAPKGLMLLQGIAEQQFYDALEARAAKLDGMGREYFGGVLVLASAGVDQVDAKLIALSQLPASFDARTFMDMSMYGYALCFGYDPREFWPVSSAAIGTATETETQHRKAFAKGGLAFTLAYQERLQQELPETLQFEFEQRDDAAELAVLAVEQAKADVVRALYEAGLKDGAPLLSREQALRLAAQHGLIPEEWTLADENVSATDTDDSDLDAEEEAPPAQDAEGAAPQADRWLALPRVQRALAVFPDDDIVRYSWDPKRRHAEQLAVLWRPRNKPRFHAAAKVRREDGVLYQDGDLAIREADVDRAIDEAGRRVPGLEELLNAPEMTEEQRKGLGE